MNKLTDAQKKKLKVWAIAVLVVFVFLLALKYTVLAEDEETPINETETLNETPELEQEPENPVVEIYEETVGEVPSIEE